MIKLPRQLLPRRPSNSDRATRLIGDRGPFTLLAERVLDGNLGIGLGCLSAIILPVTPPRRCCRLQPVSVPHSVTDPRRVYYCNLPQPVLWAADAVSMQSFIGAYGNRTRAADQQMPVASLLLLC